MWENLLGGRSYAGSSLDRLIQGRLAEIRSVQPATQELCAANLLREHPETFKFAANQGGAQSIDQQTRDAAALANVVLVLLISSTAAAEHYGRQIDQLRQSNSVAA